MHPFSKKKPSLSSSIIKKQRVMPPSLAVLTFVEFELTPEAAQFLSHVQGPVGLVAVAGMYRTGKSYLLNRMLLDRSNGFGVGPSINPCTKVPIQIQTVGSVDLGFASKGDHSRWRSSERAYR